eukprot:scaffold31003_cov66-Phaeocystis_antarctica.AAC.4
MSMTERWPWPAAAMRASTLAPRFRSSLTISRWPWRAAACSRPKVALASPRRVVDLDGQRGGRRAHHGLGSVRWGSRRGVGRLWRCCVLPKELCCGRLALGLGPLQSGALVYVDQLVGVGPDQQQSVHVPQHLAPTASVQSRPVFRALGLLRSPARSPRAQKTERVAMPCNRRGHSALSGKRAACSQL